MLNLLSRLLVFSILAKRLRSKGRDSARRPASPAKPSSSPAAAPPIEGEASQPVRPPSGTGASPDSPLDLEPADWKATLKRTVKEIKDDRIPLVAAGMAYYFFLAIFPALIAFIGILGLANVDTQGIVDGLERNLPGGSGSALVEAVSAAERPSDSASLAAAIFGIAAALWTASSGMGALQMGLDVAYDIDEDRKFIAKRAVGLVLLIATLLLGGVPSPFFSFGDGVILSALGWILTLAAIGILFSLYYYLGPNRKSRKWQWVSVGGIAGAVLWVAVSLGFSFYVSEPDRYTKTYGTLGGVIVLILWLFLSSLAVLIGGELNAELERQGRRGSSPA